MTAPDWDDLARRMGVSAATARSYLRRSVPVPGYGHVTGAIPGASGAYLLEHRLRDQLARQLGGVTEAKLPFGRPDVLTAEAVFEVEPRRSWRHGMRQALAYSAQCGLPPALALFGAITKDEMLALLRKVPGGNHHAVPVAVQLWWHDGHKSWWRVTSRATCRTVGAPREVG